MIQNKMKKTPKGQTKKAKKSFNKVGEGLLEIATGTAKITLNVAKGIYETVDSADLAISEKIDHKLGKSSNKIISATRRNIIKILLPVILSICGGNAVYNKVQDKNKEKIEIKIDDENNTTLLNLKDLDYKITTPEGLKGVNVSNLYSHYLGFYGENDTIGDTITFKPNEILGKLYESKFNLKNKDSLRVATTYYNNIIKNTDFDLVKSIDLDTLKSNIKNSIDSVNKHFDREKFGTEKLKNNVEKIELFKNLCSQIDEKCLLAYGMTELMPSNDGTLNQLILDFMLQNGGEKFVMNIPAIADSYASFGLYQFTSYAIYDIGDKRRGASVINLYLPSEHKIAGSVTKLATKDHHQAAYMFAMYNLYTLVFSADKEMMNALKLLSQQKDNNNLTQLIAIMHNYPANGKVFLKEWYKLNTDKKYLEQKQGKNKEKYNYDINKNNQIDLYEAYVNFKKTSHNYGKKTYFNRKSL